MKFITVRQEQKLLTLILFIIALFGIVCIVLELISNYTSRYSSNMILGGEYILLLYNVILYLGCFIYCWSEKPYRNKFYKKGKCYEGNIIQAEWLFNGRGESTYYLIIEFHDGYQKRLRKTNGYVGNPNNKLRSTKCSVYEYKGKYMEGDFDVLDKVRVDYLDIPIVKHKNFRLKGKEYV